MASQSPLPSDQNNLKWVYRMFIALLLFLLAAWVVWLYFSSTIEKDIPQEFSDNKIIIQEIVFSVGKPRHLSNSFFQS